jgi:hypothetical protein
MTAAALLPLLHRADEKASYDQLRTWVVAQAVRNTLQTFHGCPAFHPDNPASGIAGGAGGARTHDRRIMSSTAPRTDP